MTSRGEQERIQFLGFDWTSLCVRRSAGDQPVLRPLKELVWIASQGRERIFVEEIERLEREGRLPRRTVALQLKPAPSDPVVSVPIETIQRVQVRSGTGKAVGLLVGAVADVYGFLLLSALAED